MKALSKFVRCFSQFPNRKPINGVSNVVIVGSGKGGVGKSTVSSNLALSLRSLQKEDGNNLEIGLLDADVYGPSIHHIFDIIDEEILATPEGLIQPIEKHGIQILSVGSLVDETSAVIWRGGAATGAIKQLMFDTEWNDLDVLVVDLPPGTGDVQISIGQETSVAGAVIVSTPNEISLLDVKRAINMFEKFEIPIIGVVENMSHFECPNCQHKSHIFGDGGARRLCVDNEYELIGEIPYEGLIMQNCERGMPSAIQSDINEPFLEIARNVWDFIKENDEE